VHGVSYNKHTGRTECIIVGKEDAQKLFASFFAFAYALPLLFICTLYLLIVQHLRSKKQTVRRLNGTVATGSERKRHVTKVVIIVVATFAICWLPLHLHLLVAYYGKLPETVTYKILLILWQALSFINSMMNPIIYSYLAKDFRDAFRETLCCLNDRNNSSAQTNIITTGNHGNAEDDPPAVSNVDQ
jgi:allatostatin receptor